MKEKFIKSKKLIKIRFYIWYVNYQNFNLNKIPKSLGNIWDNDETSSLMVIFLASHNNECSSDCRWGKKVRYHSWWSLQYHIRKRINQNLHSYDKRLKDRYVIVCRNCFAHLWSLWNPICCHQLVRKLFKILYWRDQLISRYLLSRIREVTRW